MTSKFALVIANTEYQDASFAKLTAPGKDADEFAQVLRELAGFDDVQVLLNEGESRTRRSIARFFAERKRDDLLLLYFSGHGVRNEQGHLFLAANDTEMNILDASGVPAEFVTQSMNNSRSQRQLLILDCCNSGAFAHGSKSATSVGKSMGIATAFEGSGFGRVVLTATDATQYAWEGDKVIGDTQKSVFTHFLIEGLKGEADRDGDGRIHVDELYDYVYEQIVTRTPKQTPGKWSYKQQGDLILRENLNPHEIKLAPLPTELLEMLGHPNSGVRRAGIQELANLLDGRHQGLARAALEKLREIAENDDSLTLRRTANETLNARGLVFEQPVPVVIPKEEKLAHVPPLPVRDREIPRRGSNGEGILPRKTPEQKKNASKFTLRFIVGITGGFLLIAIIIWGIAKIGNIPSSGNFDSQTLATSTISTGEFQTTNTYIPSPTLHPTIAPITSPKDGMTLLFVPAGEFTMGSEAGGDDEKPVHTVYLDAYWIDETEVTFRMYYMCVEAGVCKNSPEQSRNYGTDDFDNYPVVYVTWNSAKTYCEWADRRLPTEAEWEKAARGETAIKYPWGNDPPNSNLLNYNGNIGNITEVGAYPNGASPYGSLDMAGNVWEWVNDRYSETYYSSSPLSNPEGPDLGPYGVLRGGSWSGSNNLVRSADRVWSELEVGNLTIGFRCAMDATP